MERIWIRFLLLFVGNFVISLVLSCLIWQYALGRELNLKGENLDLDFFNVLGVVFTIIGLGIAIYQIAELRSRQHVIEETTKDVKKQGFKLNALERYLGIRSQLESLQRRINSEVSFEEKVISKYADLVTSCVNSLNTIIEYQKALTTGPIIDCEKCVTLLSDMRGALYKVIEERSYASFKKQTFIINISEALKVVSQHEANLKL